MDRLSQIRLLAELYGISTEYKDNWNTTHQVSGETLEKLLLAMGVDLQDRDDLDALIEERRLHSWFRPVPPVIVGKESPTRIDLNLSPRLNKKKFSWSLIQEDGTGFSGEFFPTDLEVKAVQTYRGENFTRYSLDLPPVADQGYHRFSLRCSTPDYSETWEAVLIVVPSTCYVPPLFDRGRRLWGIALQLYSISSEKNWGMGDFGDLMEFVEQSKKWEPDVIGLNPLHSLFPNDSSKVSPYSPSNRQFLNVLYLDVEAIPDYEECPEVREYASKTILGRRLHSCEGPFVDFDAVASAKKEVFEILFRHFCKAHLSHDLERGKRFREFQREEGVPLFFHSVFEALQEHFSAGSNRSWTEWPPEFKDPHSTSVLEFARTHMERVEFFQYLQWQSRIQFHSVSAKTKNLGFALGLYPDLALGPDANGSEVWANQSIFCRGATTGAPPDEFSLKGQDWGLPPMNPHALIDSAYRHFVLILRQNMRDAGVLRIDHVLSLMRLFWIPVGGSPQDGAYVQYPFEDLLGIVALESRRNRCVVIGEDLGTIPENFRNQMAACKIFSYRVLIFEKKSPHEFKLPDEYPENALVTATTHDLPTLSGFWTNRDFLVRSERALFPSPEVYERQIVRRSNDRTALLSALRTENLLPPDVRPDSGSLPGMDHELMKALFSYLARTPSRIVMVQIEDVLEVEDQVNLPGTRDEPPNWRRKLPISLSAIFKDPRFSSISDTIRKERFPGKR